MIAQKALVTGATSGIGEGVARRLHAEGVELILVGRNEERLKRLGDELEASTLQGDLTDARARALLVALIHQETPDLVVNAAGLGFYGPAVRHPTSDGLQVLEVDAAAVYELTVEAAKALLAADRPGTILNVSSAGAYFAFPHFAAYAAAKACVNSFSLALDEELRPFDVRVLCSCPGRVKTRFQERAARETKRKKRKGMMSIDFAVDQIVKQIRKQKSLVVFDWRYRLGVFVSRFLPRRFLSKRLSARVETID